MTLTELDKIPRRVILALVILLPFLLIHVRPAAEGVIAALAVFAIARILVHREWQVIVYPWLLLALAYWAWLVVTTILASTSLRDIGLALVWIRFPLAVLALAVWIIDQP